MIKLLHTLADTYKAICFLAVCLLASNILSAQTAAVTDATICNGQTAMITASGGALYHWNTGATTAIISVSPSTTTTYTVTITTGGSSVTLRSLVTVNPNPTAIITGDGLICGVGSTTVLTGTGGGTYLWSTGESTTSITVNHSDIYSVTVTNSYGCTATSDIDVEWSPIPTVRIDGVNSSICSGSSTDLTLTTVNATAFFWSNGASTPNITVSPTTATTYTVTVYSPKGCSATASCTITPHPCASVGDFVWFDGARGNPNNVQDTGEPGISNAVVSLYNNIGQLVGTTLTDNSGFYNFGGLAAGTYSVGFTTPPGMVAVEQILNTATGSDNSPSTGRTPTFALVEGQNRTDIDAGFRLQENGKASIGDRVWLDVNRDGIQDANEVTGMAGIRVSLYRTDGTTLVAVTETDGLGYYSFTNLTPTGYIVGFDIPTAYTISPRNAGTNDALDSDADPVSGLTSIYLLLPNEANTTVDLGLYPTVTPPTYGSIGDFVWEDKDKNGLQNAGERGLPGVTVTLYAADGITVLAQTTTSANGFYSFNFLAAGDYILGFTNFPTNYTFTLQTLNTATGSDANSNGRTPLISLAAGQNRTDIDAGLFPSNPFDVRFGTIGDRVWRDDNTDGIQQTNEQGVGGISVYLLDNNSQIVGVTVTDATGYYGFSRLVAGTYSVQFNVLPQGAQFTTQNAPASTAANDSDADASGHTRTIVLTTGQVNLTIDAGIILEAILGDFVWLDTNSDHLQTNGEPGVPNITVNLFLASAPNAVVQTTMTDASGIYYFHVTPNNYIVGFVNGTGYTLVAQTLGTDNGSDADPSTGKTPAITIAAGQQNYDIDAGLRTNVLPVQLVYFVGTAEGCAVTLHWQTATEENNKQFVVQRSKNGQDFETIGTIAGAGSTNVAQNYSFDDKQPSFTNTYRLLQVDFDGTTTVYSASNLVRTTGCFDGTTSGITEIYPNPNFINTVWFKFYTEAAAEDVTVAVSDVFGRVLQSQVMTVQNGSNVVSIEIKGLTTGTYYIQVTGNGWFSPAQKLVRMWK